MTSGFRGALIATSTALAIMFFCLPATPDAQRVHWKMQSAFSSQLAHLGIPAYASQNIERVSGGAFEIKFFEPGALVPALECFEAASKGSVEACWTTPGYHTRGKYPALASSSVPFGPNYGEFFAWKKFGGESSA